MNDVKSDVSGIYQDHQHQCKNEDSPTAAQSTVLIDKGSANVHRCLDAGAAFYLGPMPITNCRSIGKLKDSAFRKEWVDTTIKETSIHFQVRWPRGGSVSGWDTVA
ncbi:MAG: hypothetical protein DMF69_18425 [Acidobacteria bacterium]|nr:MAG: hypothetical protein DMF69_18425 [Acidobacteriota bacterium]